MAQDNFIIELLAMLKKSESKKQIKSDIKDLGDIKIPLIGSLSKTKTKAQLKQDLSSLNGTVKLTGKVDKKGVTTSVQQATQQAQKTVKSQPVQVDVVVKKKKLINDIKLLGQQNSRLFKDVNMTAKYNSLLDSAELATSNTELSNLRTQLGSFRSELKVTGNAGMTMTDALKNGLSKIFQLFGGHGIIMQFTKQLRNAWTEAKKLDSEMTDLARVNAEISRDNFPDYLDKCIAKCKQLSVAVKDYIASVTTFSRAGYNLADSEALADMAVQLEKVGDMGAEDASKALLSGIQAYSEIDGYGMDQLAEKAQALNDKIDLIGNTASLTQKEAAEGIEAVGSVMNDANTSVDEFLALLGAANRTVQDSNKVALAIRTAALRIRSCTAELEEMGETTDDVIESTADLAKHIKALTNINGSGGVDILEADGETFRSIFDIFNDISKVYDKMSDKNASALLDLIAGKNRSNQISAVLNNMAEANDLLNKSLNATGTASAEYQVYLESAEAATERFGVAITESYNNIVNGETVRALADTGTAVLEYANKWELLESTLKGFLAIGVMKGIGTLTTAIRGSIIQVTNFGTALDTIGKMESLNRKTEEYSTSLDKLKSSCVYLTDAQLKQVLASKALGETERIEILCTTGLTEEQAKARLIQMGLTQATNAQTAANASATASTFSFSAAVKGLGANLKAAFLSNPIGIAIMAISTVIGFAISATNKYNQELEESRRKAIELTNAYKEQQSSLEAQTKKYKELKESLDSGNLSTDETRSIKEQLLEIQSSLIESYGNEASNLDLVNGKYKEQLGLLSELSKDKATEYIRKHKDMFDEATEALEKTRTYNLGTIATWSSLYPKSEEQQKLLDFIESYSDLLELNEETKSSRGSSFTSVNLSVKADIESAEKVINEFLDDLEQYSKENNLDIDALELLDGTSKQLREMWTDELTEFKSIRDEYIKAQITENDTLRPLYQQSISAVEAYNQALSSGEGIEEAKTNLYSLQLSVQEATGELEGSQEIFDDIYEGINKNAEAAYNLNQAFENDDTVKQYAEQLRGLSDVDIKAINFDNDNLEKGEESFRGLIDTLGLTEDQAQTVIDKLVELGYVYGSVVDSVSDLPTFDLTTYEKPIDDFQSKLKTLGDTLSSIQSGNFEDSDLTDLLQEFPELADKTDDLETAIVELINNALKALYDTLGEDIPDGLKTSLQDLADIASGTAKHLGDAFSDIHDSWDILHDFKETMDKGFDSNVTDSLLQSVRKLSGELETLVAGYYSGVVSAEQLYEALTQHYENDLHNYSEALIKKNELNEDFYNAVGLASEEVTNQFMDDYDVDIKNCTTYNQAKLEIEKQTLGKISAMWSQYYDAQSKTLKLSMSEIEARATHGGGDAKAFLEQYELIENYEAAIEALNNITYDGIRTNFEGIGSKLSANSSSSSSSSSTKSEFEETIDFFERRVNVLSDALSLLETNLDNVTGAFAKNNLIDAELGLTEEKFKNYSDALNMYTQKANEALSKLPSDIAQKIRNGAVALTDFIGDGNKDVVDAIKDYESWADKIADCQQELAELKTAIRQLELEKFNNIISDFTDQFDIRDKSINLIDKQMDLLEEAGELIGESFFTAQKEQAQKQLEILKQEQTQLANQLSSALASGYIERGTEEWLEMVSALADVEGSILDCQKSIESFDNSILSIHWNIFSRIQDAFSNINDEIGNLVGLLDDIDVINEGTRDFSNQALTKLGLLSQEYELAKYRVQQYNDQIEELKSLYAQGRYSTVEFTDKLAELTDQMWANVNASEQAKQGIIDLNKARIDAIVDGIEKEIDAYKKLTNEAIDNLKAQKD